MNTNEPNSTNNTPAPRRWRKRGLITAVLVVAAGLAWWFLAGNGSGTAVTAQVQQPAGQSTAGAANSASGQPDETGALPQAGQPITGTLGLPGGPPRSRAGAAVSAAPAATPTAAAGATQSGIISVAGMDGATIQPLDGSAPASVKAAARLTLLARSADDRWLLASKEGATGWVLADAVIAFNIARLPVAESTPPAAALTAPAAASAVSTAAAPDVDALATADAAASAVTGTDVSAPAAGTASTAAPIMAVINSAETRGLNVRAGPGTAYAKRGALGADDAVTVVGRTADGAWLEVQSSTLDGGSGWASAYYLVVDGDISGLPVTAAESTTDADVATVQTVALVDDAGATAPATTLARAASPSASTGLNGTLVFQSGQGGAIYAYDLDSGSLWPLTSGFDPAVSPDGQTVVFTRQGVDGGLYLIDIDGGNERRIYTGPLNMASPKWSEGGSSIVFSYAVSSMECRDMGPGRCVPDSEFLHRPLQSVDPNDYPLIVLYDYDLGVVAADGSNFHSLSALHSSRAPDWSAAGIVYQSEDGIQIIQDAPGSSSQVVTYDMLKPAYQDPDWQPGGGRIVFQQSGASHWEIWAVDPNGGGMVALTQPRTVLVDALPSNVAPAWSPDGSKIVFVSNREADGEAGAWRLWVMDADGGNQQQLPIDVEMNYTFGAEQMVSWGQ